MVNILHYHCKSCGAWGHYAETVTVAQCGYCLSRYVAPVNTCSCDERASCRRCKDLQEDEMLEAKVEYDYAKARKDRYGV